MIVSKNQLNRAINKKVEYFELLSKKKKNTKKSEVYGRGKID